MAKLELTVDIKACEGLNDEIDAVFVDARRYRWLRDNGGFCQDLFHGDGNMDEMIDAEMTR